MVSLATPFPAISGIVSPKERLLLLHVSPIIKAFQLYSDGILP